MAEGRVQACKREGRVLLEPDMPGVITPHNKQDDISQTAMLVPMTKEMWFMYERATKRSYLIGDNT